LEILKTNKATRTTQTKKTHLQHQQQTKFKKKTWSIEHIVIQLSAFVVGRAVKKLCDLEKAVQPNRKIFVFFKWLCRSSSRHCRSLLLVEDLGGFKQWKQEATKKTKINPTRTLKHK